MQKQMEMYEKLKTYLGFKKTESGDSLMQKVEEQLAKYENFNIETDSEIKHDEAEKEKL